MKKKYLVTVISCLFSSFVNSAETLLDDVVVSVTRAEQNSFDAPGSIQSVNRNQIENAGAQINISESLATIPGVVSLNRNNFAQDLQVSIRGYGSRAPFGVRGVKLFIDGIPQTLADGQGQTSQFALTSTERIEVLRGPISSLYGNASGGVLQVFTKNPTEVPELSVGTNWGAYGLLHSNVQYSEKKSNVGIVVDAARFESTGFRSYSEAKRDHLNTKLDFETDRGKASLIVNYLDNKLAQDPGSLTQSQYTSNPYQVQTGNKEYGAGKSFTQGIYGINFDGKVNSDFTYNFRTYYGNRHLDNPTRTSSTYIVLDRDFMGAAASTSIKTFLAGVPVKYTSGIEYDYLFDKRLGYTNQLGGIKGTLNRDEDNIAYNAGAFIQSEWFLSERFTGLLAARYSAVKLQVKDRFLSDASKDGSGSKKYSGFSPVAGLTYHLNNSTNLYAQIGAAYETPTLNEVLYTPTAFNASTNKFYSGISAGKSIQSEIGLKWRYLNQAKLDLAIFHAKTSNDLVPYFLSTSGSTWQNADTSRYGLELSGFAIVTPKVIARGALTLINARYDQAISVSSGAVSAGSKLPGVPQNQFYVELSWRSVDWAVKAKQTFSEIGIEYRSAGKMYADSRNQYSTDGYQLTALRIAQNFVSGPHRLTLLGRMDNLFDHKYVSSVVVDQASSQYFEPGAPRSWLLGIKYSLNFN